MGLNERSTEDDLPQEPFTIYIGVGVAFGAAFGIAIGAVTGELNTLIAIGAGLG